MGWRFLPHTADLRLSLRAASEEELRERGVWVRSPDKGTVAEEIPEAYKDVAEVVDVVAAAGLARKVARIVPMAVVKG